jgi:uncharacterized protein YcbX
MLVDAQNRFVTARNHPRLTLVETSVLDHVLYIKGPDMAELRVPLHLSESELTQVEIWRDRSEAVCVGQPADPWFSEFLSMSVRLVQLTDKLNRPIDPAYGRGGDEVSFADGYTVLLLSQASLEALNQRLVTPVSMRHFRPNIVVTGCDAHSEDRWRRIRVGEVEFEG